MASDSRTLKLAILGEVKDLSASLKTGSNEISSFGEKLTKFGRVAGAAFFAATVAATAYASKLLVDGVKSALEDEKAQRILAKTLENVTGATKAQIAEVEKWISTTALATGVTDDELRPAFSRLVRSTKDVTEAQKLLSLALDISSATGKPLESVASALSKAFDGNAASLGRLGLGIDSSILKSKDFDRIFNDLKKTFKGFADEEANTFQGKLERLKVGFDELKETIGFAVLPILTDLVNYTVKYVAPALQSFVDSFTSGTGLNKAFNYFAEIVKTIFSPALEGVRYAFNKIKDAVGDTSGSWKTFFDFLKDKVAPFLGGALKVAISVVGEALAFIVRVLAKVIDGFQTFFGWVNKVGDKIGNFYGFGGGRASGGPVMGGTTYLVGEQGPELFTPTGNGTIIPNGAFSGKGGGNSINITVNGAIDPISTARQIAQILNREATLSGNFNKVGASLLVGA
jgi:hypothetical protein